MTPSSSSHRTILPRRFRFRGIPSRLALLPFLCLIAGCGDEKKPPVESGPRPIALLRPFTGENSHLSDLILAAAKATHLEFREIRPGDLKSSPPPSSTVVVAAISPSFSTDQIAALENIFKGGAKLVLVGTPGQIKPSCTTLIHPDDLAFGAMAGHRTTAELARQSESQGRASITGNVVQIRASDDDPASRLRHRGFLDILDRHPGVIFVHDGPGFWREADAQKRMEEALRIQKNIRAVFAHSDEMARGARAAVEAFQNAHPGAPEVAIIGIGEDPKFAAVRTLGSSLSLEPVAQKAIEIATRLVGDRAFQPPAEIAVKPQ